jgi:hypothetical protein
VIKRQELLVVHVKLLVLEWADELLSRGFKEQIYQVFQHLSPAVQVCLFSTTMSGTQIVPPLAAVRPRRARARHLGDAMHHKHARIRTRIYLECALMLSSALSSAVVHGVQRKFSNSLTASCASPCASASRKKG